MPSETLQFADLERAGQGVQVRQTLRRAGQRAACLAGFVIATVALAALRHVLTARWVLRSDDGLWLSIARRWTGSVRLYEDLWENKGPLFFLFLKAVALVPSSAPYLAHWELLLFWLPLLCIFAVATAHLAVSFQLGRAGAALLGASAALIAWSALTWELFATERIGAALGLLAVALVLRSRQDGSARLSTAVALATTAGLLCNFRFGAFGLLYLFIPKLSPRAVLRDASLCLGLAAVVLVAAVGFHAGSIRYLLATVTNTLAYRSPTLREHLAAIVDARLIGRSSLDLLAGPFRFLFAPGGRAADWLTVSLGLVMILLAFEVARAFKWLAFSAATVIVSIHATGYAWDHTFALLFPYFIFLAADQLSRKRRAVAAGLSLWCVLFLAMEAFGPEETSLYRRLSNPTAIEGSERTARAFTLHLAGRRWVSLLSNDLPPLLAPGVPLPLQRNFHLYCFMLPRQAEAQLEQALGAGGVRVAIAPHLDAPGCLTRPLVELARSRCNLLALDEGIEFRDCPPKP